MKVKVVTQVAIVADRPAVFKYLKELRYHFLWNPPLQSIKPIITLELGAKYSSTSMMLGKKIITKNEVTKFEADSELELANNTGMIHYRVNYCLKSQGKKTLVICNTAVSSESKAFAFAKPVLEILARRELQADLQALKIAVEQKLT